MSLFCGLRYSGLGVPIAGFLVATLVAVFTLLGLADRAAADFEIVKWRAGSFELDNDTAVSQAGAHPQRATFELEMSHLEDETGSHTEEDMKNVVVDLPPGFLGDPTILPTCSRDRLISLRCPVASQVGVMTLSFSIFNEAVTATTGVYNMAPRRGELADFGFVVSGVPIHVVSTLRASDYGIRTRIPNISEAVPVYASKLVLWGTPAAAEHDDQRAEILQCMGDSDSPGCVAADGGSAAGVAPQAFMSNPTSCQGQLTTSVKVESWTNPGVWKTAQSTTASPMTGCELLSFSPTVSVAVEGKKADSPTGLDVDISMPPDRSPKGLAPAHLKQVQMKFPDGMHINPSLASGLTACLDEQLALGTNSGLEAGENGCPFASKIGTASATSPAVEGSLSGALYVRPQASSDPESGQMFRLALVLKNVERGLIVKVPGEIRADGKTGQLVANFDNNPQLPVSRVQIALNGGSRAPLVTPAGCGTYEIDYTLRSWGGQTVTRRQPFVVNQGCDLRGEFTPGFEAGTADPAAGSFSPFFLRVTREEGEQNVSSLSATLPEGLLAKLAGVPLCPDAAAVSGACSPASQLGTVTVGTGTGANPLYVPQPGKPPTALYLAGPYKGAPYSLIAVIPAQAGPFDLGTVAVRNALHIDPVTTEVTTVSDPLPQILRGIPISYRDVRINVTRDRFTVNPTDCDPMGISSRIISSRGSVAAPSERFQAANCAALGFNPKLALRLSGAPPRRGGFPKLTATLTMPKKGANIGKAVVTMPRTQFLENAHIRTVCTRVQYAAESCPKGSVYGYAKAWTPLLDQPLQGPVYLRSSNNKLPDLVADLDGQIDIELAGRIDSVNERLRTTFWAVPDAPVSKFRLTMQGGRKGLLVNNTNLCKATPRANVRFTGQNGKVAAGNPKVKVTGCGKKQRK